MRCKICCCCCEHGRLRGQCKECGGSSSSCEHRRQRYYCNCKECGGSSFCEHRRQRSQCKECGRSSFCEHGRPRDYCNCTGYGRKSLHARMQPPTLSLEDSDAAASVAHAPYTRLCAAEAAEA